MSRMKRIGFFSTASAMLFCLLLSSTDLLIKEDVAEVKKISVYVACKEGPYLNDFKRGIQEIANGSRVDVNYAAASGSESEDALTQIENEFEGGTQAVIIFSDNPGSVRQRLKENKKIRPVITANAFDNGMEGMPDVSFDVREASEKLADAVQNEYGKKRKVLLLTGEEEISGEISQAVKEAFREKEMEAFCVKATEENLRKYKKKQENPIWIGCWITETEWALKHMKKELLYSVGYSDEILKGMREGEVKGLAAFSMYAIGIHTIQQAAAAIEKEETRDVKVPCRIVTKENMNEEEEFLIPIH